MNFIKYQHIERIGTAETEGLLEGKCYIFPKLDGTNASVWDDPEKGIQTGSRNRHLSPESDNAGFCNYIYNDPRFPAFFYKNPTLRLYGEWLVPHSLKTYREDAWRKFYVFDVYVNDIPLTYAEYTDSLRKFDIDHLHPLIIVNNPDINDLYKYLDQNTFLIKDGQGIGEGIVIKNYDYLNKFGRKTWGKLITNEFREKHIEVMGSSEHNNILIEELIIRDFLTDEFVKKEQAKIALANDGWSSKNIPELLGRTWHEFIKEEMTEILKKHKNPEINFRLLNKLALKKTKEVIGI